MWQTEGHTHTLESADIHSHAQMAARKEGKSHKAWHWSDSNILMELHTRGSMKYDHRAAPSIPTSCSRHKWNARLTKADNTTATISKVKEPKQHGVPGCQLLRLTLPLCQVFKSICFFFFFFCDIFSNKNWCLPCDAWQRVGREEGERRLVSLYEPNGVLTALLGVQEHDQVQAAWTLLPLQPRAQYPGAAERWTIHPEELAWGGWEKRLRYRYRAVPQSWLALKTQEAKEPLRKLGLWCAREREQNADDVGNIAEAKPDRKRNRIELPWKEKSMRSPAAIAGPRSLSNMLSSFRQELHQKLQVAPGCPSDQSICTPEEKYPSLTVAINWVKAKNRRGKNVL